MPAPDLATLYRVEPAIEEAWRGILESEGIDAYIQRDQLDLPVPRLTFSYHLAAQQVTVASVHKATSRWMHGMPA